MQGYGPSSYGEGFADVYDEWYHGVSDVAATVRELVELAGDGPVLELGVGTGRLAVPLADAGAMAGIIVHGVDTSEAMLERLREKDGADRVVLHHGDMVDELPSGPFALVFVAYNTLFNLTEPGRQAECFRAVAAELSPGGRFVVEAFVPDEPPRAGSEVGVRSLTADRVVLSLSVHRPDEQIAEGQFVELSTEGGVRMRPWMIRYASPTDLDDMARDAGFELEHRWRAFDDRSTGPDDDRHVSVYRLRTSDISR